MSQFKQLVERLQKEGFQVEILPYNLYQFARITGKNIFAGFCDPHENGTINSSYSYINGSIAADHVECFDKWRRCPLNLPLPSNEKEMVFLMKQLHFLGSEEGYVTSNECEHEKYVLKYPDIHA